MACTRRRQQQLLSVVVPITSILTAVVIDSCFGFLLDRNCNTAPKRQQQRYSSSSSSKLFGIAEWRDFVFVPEQQQEEHGDDYCKTKLGELPNKPICLLPFPFDEALVQGQTKELRLYEDRFLELFDDVVENHEGVLAMALFSGEDDAGILGSCPICEITDYNRGAGEGFGVFLTIKCVGRATLKKVAQEEPYIKAECVELMDNNEEQQQGLSEADLVLGNSIADGMERVIEDMTTMECEISNQLIKQGDIELPDDANYEKLYSEENNIMSVDDDDDDEDDDDDDEDGEAQTRLGRYRQAYQQALESDTQGYYFSSDSSSGLSSSSSSSSKDDVLGEWTSSTRQKKNPRTAQELTAISWALFSTEAVYSVDAAYRVQALDINNLLERLKLGSYLMHGKYKLVKNMFYKNRNDNNNIDEEEGFA